MEQLLFHPFRIRSFKKGDETSMTAYADNKNVSIHLRDSFPSPYRLADAKNWIKIVKSQEPESNFAIASADEVIGGIGLLFFADVHRYTAEVGYWLAEPFWGKGIATAALKKFIPFAFNRFEIERLYAGVFDGNPGSCRVLEKCGFKKEGVLRSSVMKDGVLKDQHVYGLLRSELGSGA